MGPDGRSRSRVRRAGVVNTTTMLHHPFDQIAALTPISLDQLNDAAALQQRVDRKYVVDAAQLATVLDALQGRMAALEIDGVVRSGTSRSTSTRWTSRVTEPGATATASVQGPYPLVPRHRDDHAGDQDSRPAGNTVKRRQPHPFEGGHPRRRRDRVHRRRTRPGRRAQHCGRH